MTKSGLCNWCLNTAPLVDGHTIPRFVIQWFLDTSMGAIRDPREPNRRAMDIPALREFMMCATCDNDAVGSLEREFANAVFYPFVNDGKRSFRVTESLRRFAASVVWRALVVFRMKKYNRDSMVSPCLAAERAWHGYLTRGGRLRVFDGLHLYAFDETVPSGIGWPQDRAAPVNAHRFLKRSFLCNVFNRDGAVFVACKFPRFLVIGEILKGEPFYARRLTPGHVLDFSTSCALGDFGEHLLELGQASHKQYFDNLSDKQSAKIAERFKRNAGEILASDYGKARGLDDQIVKSLGLTPGEPCVCESGLTFRECHGR